MSFARFQLHAFLVGCLAMLGLPSIANGQTYLYCVSGGDVAGLAEVSGYSIDPLTGVLTQLPKSPYLAAAGGSAEFIAVDPSSRFAYVTNAGTNNINGYVIDTNTGDLISMPGLPFPAGNSPHGIVVDPSGKFVYAENLGDNDLSEYSIDQQSGALTSLGTTPTGPNPNFNLAYTPDGRLLYVPNTNNGGPGSVSAYSINPQTGALSTIGSPVPAGTGADWVAVDPLGRFAYVSNGWTGTSIYGFGINALTGSLSPLAGSPYPSGKGRGLAIDPKGRFVFIANDANGTVTVFTVNQTTGALTQQGQPYTGGDTTLIVDPSGNFLYAASVIYGGVFGYRINQSTGALTLIPGSPFPSQPVPTYLATATPKGTSGLSVQFFQPTQGGNAGTVTMQIVGSGFQSGTTVTLTGLGPDIVGTNTTALDPSVLTTTFNLTGMAPGVRNILITNSDGSSVTSEAAFTVEQGGQADLGLEILGGGQIRIGSEQSYFLAVSNTGSVDGILSFAAASSENTIVLSGLSAIAALGCSFNTPPVDIVGANSTSIYSGICHTSSSGCGQTFSYQAQDLSNRPDCSNEKLQVQFLKARIAAAQASLAKAQSDLAAARADYANKGCASHPNTPECIAILAQINALINQIASLNQLIADLTNQLKVALQNLLNCLKGQQGSSAETASSSSSATDPVISGSITLCGVSSVDPNDKIGPGGVGAQRWIGPEPLPYSIFFGNEPSATAPAQDVVINDPLDSTNVNLSGLILGPISAVGNLVSPPPVPLGTLGTYATDVDLRPTANLILRITVSINVSTGLLSWHFQSIDPATGLPTTDPSAGFLPPGANGSVAFTVIPKQSLATKTQIQNQASVVFDVNPPINTPTWLNTIDNTPPISHVVALPPTESSVSFPLTWSGTDIGAGIQDFTIFVSDNGAPFTIWSQNIAATSGTFTGQVGHTYAFYSIARDLVGNTEAGKTSAEATTRIEIDTTPPVITPNISGTLGANGWYTSAVTVSWSVADPESGISSSTGCSPTTLTNDTAGTVLTCSATNGAGLSNSVSVTIKIDQTPPVISGLPAPGCVLWPPNHKLVQVGTVAASDAGSGMESFSVTGTSNDPDCDIKRDIVITGSGLQPRTVQLEAERSGAGNGRVYALTAIATDQAGNHTMATATCTVPHNR